MKVIVIFFYWAGRTRSQHNCVSGVGDHQILKCDRGGGFKKGACHKILWGSGVMSLRTHPVSLSVWCERLHD